MTTTPRVWKSLSQVNTSDAPVAPGGTASQTEGQIAPLQDGGYVVVWTDSSRMYNPFGFAIVGQRYDAAGNKVGGEVKISQFSDGDQRSPAVTVLANGNIAVAFVDIFGFNDDIYVRIFDPALNLVREDVIDRGVDQTYEPSITALTDGSYVVSYTMSVGDPAAIDVAMRRVSATGVVSGQVDIDNQTDSQIMSEVATLSNGNFVAVYRDDFNGTLNDTDIKYEIFTPVGTPVAGPANVPGGVGFGLETEPDVAALRDGGFVVVWTDPDSSVTDIRASILSNSGSPVAFDILVNTTTAGEQNEARIVALADGGFLVTWEDDNANLVRAQRFDATGQKIGTEFTVKNGISPAVEESPEAAVLSDGRIAYAIGDFSTGDLDVMTSIYSIAAPNDFNANGISDILWQGSDGTPAIWLMNGTSTTSVGVAGTSNPGPTWQVKDNGDFNGDGRSDILWQSNDGTPAIWLMNGLTATSTGAAGPFNPGPSWQIKATGDFNFDTKADILWQNSDGTPAIWLMDGPTALSTGAVGPFNPGPSWQIKATGDFNGDGTSDILWQNSDGTPAIWLMNGMNFISGGVAGSFNPGPSWQIKATGDFNGDGTSDILWQNSDGTPAIWLMNGMNAVTVGAVGPFNPGPSWHVEGTGDYNGDGKSDILWQSDDGTPAIWFMNGMNFIGGGAAGSFNPGSDWQVIV